MSKHKLFLVQVAQSHPQIQFEATDSHRVWIKVTIAYAINQPTYKSYMLLITGNIYIYIYRLQEILPACVSFWHLFQVI